MILLLKTIARDFSHFHRRAQGVEDWPLSASLESFNKDIDKNRATTPVRGSKAFADG
jgi:hypothetical protein